MVEPLFSSDAIGEKLIIELTDYIRNTPRDASCPEPQGRALPNAALILQAGLRTLWPLAKRADVILPSKDFPNDPVEVRAAQLNYVAVYKSGIDVLNTDSAAAEKHKMIAYSAILTAASQLDEQGYKAFASEIVAWVGTQCPHRPETHYWEEAIRNLPKNTP